MISQTVLMILPDEIGGPQAGEKDKDQPCSLQPEGIEGPADGDDKRLAPGKYRVQQAVFLYNTLQCIFDIGNSWHFAYCSLKISVSLKRVKTEVSPQASNRNMRSLP